MRIYHDSRPAQQRCASILTRSFSDAFTGPIILEDDLACRLQVVCSRDEQHLLLDLFPQTSLVRVHAVLTRNPWRDDYIGQLVYEDRRYELGAKFLYTSQLRLKIFCRPLHLLQLGILK
jgi:hypothetical protein